MIDYNTQDVLTKFKKGLLIGDDEEYTLGIDDFENSQISISPVPQPTNKIE